MVLGPMSIRRVYQAISRKTITQIIVPIGSAVHLSQRIGTTFPEFQTKHPPTPSKPPSVGRNWAKGLLGCFSQGGWVLHWQECGTHFFCWTVPK
jgi:hypothetical protein